MVKRKMGLKTGKWGRYSQGGMNRATKNIECIPAYAVGQASVGSLSSVIPGCEAAEWAFLSR